MTKSVIVGNLPYLILDCGDGSARVQFFKNDEALDLYLEKSDGEGDLSEGGSNLTQSDLDDAMDVDDVNNEFEGQ